MKQTIILSITFMLGLSLGKAEPLNDKEKIAFVKHYREIVKLEKEFPNDPEVKVIFIDLDGDGIEEAFATSKGSFYEVGWDWAAFRQKGQEWEPIKGFDNKAKVVRAGSGVFARPGEIFRVIKNDKTVDFIILAENFDRLAPDGLGPLRKTRFSLDKEGILRQEEVIDLERYLAYSGIHHSGLISKVESLRVESFKD